MPGFKRRMLLREIHGNTPGGRNIHSWWILIWIFFIKSVVTIEWLLILFWEMQNKNSRETNSVLIWNNCWESCSQCFSRTRQVFTGFFSNKKCSEKKAQHHSPATWQGILGEWISNHMPVTGGSCGSFRDLVCVDGLAAVEYGKITDAVLKFCVRRGLFLSISFSIASWGFGKKDVQTTCQMNAPSVLVSPTAALSITKPKLNTCAVWHNWLCWLQKG